MKYLKNKYLINSSSNILQILITTGVNLLIYWFIIKKLGTDQLGVYSLIVAGVQSFSIFNMGINGGLVKFIAKYQITRQDQILTQIFTYGLLFNVIGLGILFILLYPILKYIIVFLTSEASVNLINNLLPFSILLFWLNNILSFFTAHLDGHNLYFIRNVIISITIIIFGIFATILGSKYGILGIILAQIVHCILAIILEVHYLIKKRIITSITFGIAKNTIREILGYSINLQFITLINLFSEPLIKILISKFGNLHLLGVFEVFNRLFQQLKTFLYVGIQTLIPKVSALYETNRANITILYIRLLKVVIILSINLFTLFILVIPIISHIFFKNDTANYLYIALLLYVLYCINSIALPAYIFNLGLGSVRKNLYSNIISSAVTIILGLALGMIFKGPGVIFAWSIAGTISSIYLIHNFKISVSKITLKNIFNGRLKKILFVQSFIFSIAILLEYIYINNYLIQLLIFIITLLITTIIFYIELNKINIKGYFGFGEGY